MSVNSLDGEIRDGRHYQAVRVYYEDTDFSGIVYHASYLRFMERGRTNYLRLIGADHRALFEQAEKEAPGFAFVVRHMSIDFQKPAHMDDVLDIVTAPEEVKGASVTLHQKVMRGEELAGRGACAGRLRLRRPRPADPEAAAHRHEGGPGIGRRRLTARGNVYGMMTCNFRNVRHGDRCLRHRLDRTRRCRRAASRGERTRDPRSACCAAFPARGRRRLRRMCNAPSTASSRCCVASGAT